MKLREATPLEHRRGTAFVSRERGCGMEDVRTPVFNVSIEARGLLELRKQLGLGLSEAANKIGIRAVELSELEHGKLVPEGGRKDWINMAEALKR
jgi:hypothetical protein